MTHPRTDVASATLDATGLLVRLLSSRIREACREAFGGDAEPAADLACHVAEQALGAIASSDALYHNVEHTAQVTLVGLAILRGRQLVRADVTPSDWLNAVVAMLCHDIGFVRGLLDEDRGERVATGHNGHSVILSRGGTDARLMPLHVDRGKSFVGRQFAAETRMDVPTIQTHIERTRFPVPDDPAYHACDDFSGLVRGADLIGQLSDERYLHKLSAVFFELEENGESLRQGYHEPGDLLRGYPEFYARQVAPWVGPSLEYLAETPAGREVVTRLKANLETARQSFAPGSASVGAASAGE